MRRGRSGRGGHQAGAAVSQADRLARQVQDHQPLPVVARLDPGAPVGLRPQESRKTVNEPLAPGFLHVFPPTCYRCPFGKTYPECGITCATIVEDVVEMEDPATVAAILVEPIGHTGGVIDPPEEYLPILRDICDRHNILLIFDEIITGIGRTGRMFAAETFGVTPDVVCIAKGLSGGYAPLSAMICRRPIADAFWGPIADQPRVCRGPHFRGQSRSRAPPGSPCCARSSTATCSAMPGPRANGCGPASRRWRESTPVIGDVRGKGLFQAIEFVRDRATKARFPDAAAIGAQVGRRALANGLLCRFDPHWIAFGPPLVVTAEEIDEMVAILDRSLGEVLAEVDRTASDRELTAMRRMVPYVRARTRLLMYLRFAGTCLWEFRWPLVVFTLLVLIGGLILHRYYGHDHLTFARACHAVFLMIFLESSLEFPDEWYLQPLFFMLPVLGLGAVADSLVRLAYLVFTRKQNLPEWNRMLASLCRNHFVVIGVGKVGYQVIRAAARAARECGGDRDGRRLAAPERAFRQGRSGDPGKRQDGSVLEQAGVRQASAVIVTTSDDLTNLDAAITARDLNRECQDRDPAIRRDAGDEGRWCILDADDLDVAGSRPGLHRRGDRAEDLPGISARRPVCPLHRHDHLPDRSAGGRERRRTPDRQADQYRHAARGERRERQP